MRLSDFPSGQGWKIDKNTESEAAEQKALEKALDRCDEREDPTAEASRFERDSETFVRGDETVASTAWVVEDEDLRAALFRSLDDLLTCAGRALETFLKASLGDDAVVEVSAPQRLDLTLPADRSAAQAIAVGVGPRSFYFDVVAVEQGQTLASALFLHTGGLTLAQEKRIFAPAVKRLRGE